MTGPTTVPTTDRNPWQPHEITAAAAGAAPSAQGLLEYIDSIDINTLLTKRKALLFRGFGVTEPALDGVLSALLPERLAYVHGNTPRTKVADNLYTSTEYPPEYVISMHSELSYAHAWPSRLLFSCVLPAATGGATPLVDGAAWLAALDPAIRAAFSGGIRYQQYLHGGKGLGKSWQATFETDDRDQVEKLLADSEASWEWLPTGALRTSQVRPATTRHPVTGAEVWFNQAEQWHPASLGEETMRELTALLPADRLPQSVCFADGGAIPDEYVLEVRDKGLELAVDVAWQAGDVLLVDNVAVAHGRRPFTGARRVLVAMSG